MNKKKLEKALSLASSIDGSELLDKMISTMTLEQLIKFEKFIKDIRTEYLARYKFISKSNFVNKFKIQYEVSLSTHLRCIIEIYNCEKFEEVVPFEMEMVITIEYLTDKWKTISLGGDGKLHGFEIASADDAKLLLEYFIYKAKLKAKYKEETVEERESNLVDFISELEGMNDQ